MAKTILTSFQKEALSFLSHQPVFLQNFYFTGGTVLAEYYLSHRLSEDLDFFSEQEVDSIWLTAIVKKLKNDLKAEKTDIQQSFNRNIVFVTEGKEILKAEFTYFPFNHIEPPVVQDKIRVDSLVDIAVNKLFAIYQNPSARHFIDLYLIIKKGKLKWEDLVKLARIKFDTVIDPIQLGSQLVIGGETKDLPKMLIALSGSEWRTYFLERAKDLKRQIATR